MQRTRPQAKLNLLLSSLLLVLAFQGCTSKDDIISPQESRSAKAAIVQELGNVPAPCKQVCLVAGQHMNVGTVDVAMKDGNVLVTYNVTKPNIYLSEIHLDIFTSLAQLQASKKLSNGGVSPGKFAFKRTWSSTDKVSSYTATIPKAYVDQLKSPCFFVASHAALSNGETAWGGLCTESVKGVSLDVAKQFPGRNWSVYFEFCLSDCAETIDFTYAWEDINGSSNDSDYNDLVIQSDLTKSAGELKINFLATARGASFDHKFKFKIPKAGITGIFGAPSYTEDGRFYYITVFESTRTALPGSMSDFANTEPGAPCVPFAYKEVVLTIDNTFSYDKARPYEPFISVYTSSNVNVGSAYDLYIYEVSKRDTWTAINGQVYPNGILIPADWKWPLERVAISTPYPKFSSITDGFTPNWASALADASQTFDKGICK